MFVPTPEQLSARAAAAVDTDRLIELVQQVCRIPSVLGEEGELAGFLHSVMTASGFEAASLQPVLPGLPNALGELSFGAGPGSCSRGTWTPSRCRTAGPRPRPSPAS